MNANKIVSRLYSGDYYGLVDSCYYTENKVDWVKRITPEILSSYCEGNLSPEEIRIENNKFNFALGSEDPLEHVTFFEE